MLCLAATVPQLRAQTYTVAGSDAQALGTTWDPGNTSNNMTLYSGNMYYLLKTVTYSSNTNGEYKITVNNNWTVSYGANGGSDNVSYSVNSGTGYVCFAFNSSSHVPHMVSSLQNVIVTGSDTQALGVSWGHTNTSNKMSTTDGITYTLVRNVDYTAATNNLQCKVCVNGSDYYGTSTGGNVYYNIPSAGSYTVTYNANGGTGAPSAQTKSYGVDLTLSSAKPTRTGYGFVDWNTNANGSGTSYGKDKNPRVSDSGGTLSADQGLPPEKQHDPATVCDRADRRRASPGTRRAGIPG